MKLIFDGVYFEEPLRFARLFCQYVPNTQFVQSYDFIKSTKQLLRLGKEERHLLYNSSIKSGLDSLFFDSNPYSDGIQLRSAISAYVVERLKQFYTGPVVVTGSAEELLKSVPPTQEELGFLFDVVEHYYKYSTIVIFSYDPKKLKTILDGNKNFIIGEKFTDYELNFKDDLISLVRAAEKKYNEYIGSNDFLLVNALFNEAYDYLRKHLGLRIFRTNTPFTDQWILNAKIDSIDFSKSVHNVVLDIDDVIVDFNGEGAGLLASKENSPDFHKLCLEYLNRGHFRQNMVGIKLKLHSLANQYNIGNYNLIILTARSETKDKNFIETISEEVAKSFAGEIDEREVYFDQEKNVIANYSEIYNGATFLKSYSLNLIHNKLLKESRTNSLIFFDDRIKYASAAFNTMANRYQLLVEDLSVPRRVLGLELTYINRNPVYMLKSIGEGSRDV